jgi:hypothetical protein
VKTPTEHPEREREGSRAVAAAALKLVESAATPAALFSLQMEQWLVGALLVHSVAGAFERGTGIVSAADFYVLDHAAIYSAIAQLRGRGEPADLVEVTAHMEAVWPERLASAGGPKYLAELAQNAPGALYVDRYAQVVRERALSRRLDTLATELSQSLRAPGGQSLAELALEARARISSSRHSARTSCAHLARTISWRSSCPRLRSRSRPGYFRRISACISRAQLRYSVQQAQILLAIGNTKFWNEVRVGRIKVYRDGTRSFVDREELERYAVARRAT